MVLSKEYFSLMFSVILYFIIDFYECHMSYSSMFLNIPYDAVCPVTSVSRLENIPGDLCFSSGKALYTFNTCP